MGVTTSLFDTRITDYSVQTDVSSLDPSNSSGGTGSISVSTSLIKDSVLLRNAPFTLDDSKYGTVTGRVSNIDESDFSLSISGESRLYLLNADQTVYPYVGAMEGALQILLGQVGIAPGDISVTDPTRYVINPGYKGNLWVYLKNFMLFQKLECVLNGSTIVFRDILSSGSLDPSLTTYRRSVNDQTLAKAIEINYYINDSITDDVVYPIPEQDAQIFQVNAGEKLITEIQLNSWLNTVNQPDVVDLVSPVTNYDNTNGAYCVAGNDGLPIMASQWTAQGGSLKLRVTDNPSIVELTIQAPPVEKLTSPDGLTDRFSPYSIAATSGNLYNSLHITGTGVRSKKNSIKINTGTTQANTGEEVGVTVDNPFIASDTEAYDFGVRVAQTYAGPSYTINRGSTAGTAEFGDIPGKRILTPDVNFRVTSATFTPAGISFDATMDTTMDDHDAAWAGASKTFNDWDAAWAGHGTFDNHAVVPLRKVW